MSKFKIRRVSPEPFKPLTGTYDSAFERFLAKTYKGQEPDADADVADFHRMQEYKQHVIDQTDTPSLARESMRARDRILARNYRMVYTHAHKYATHHMTANDLFQWGMMGFIRAIEIYNPAYRSGYGSRPTKITSYADFHIRAKIFAALEQSATILSVPRSDMRFYQAVNRVRPMLAQSMEIAESEVPLELMVDYLVATSDSSIKRKLGGIENKGGCLYKEVSGQMPRTKGLDVGFSDGESDQISEVHTNAEGVYCTVEDPDNVYEAVERALFEEQKMPDDVRAALRAKGIAELPVEQLRRIGQAFSQMPVNTVRLVSVRHGEVIPDWKWHGNLGRDKSVVAHAVSEIRHAVGR